MFLRQLWPGFGCAQCLGSDQVPFSPGVPPQHVGSGLRPLIGASLHIRTHTDAASPLATEKLDSCKLALKYDSIMVLLPSFSFYTLYFIICFQLDFYFHLDCVGDEPEERSLLVDEVSEKFWNARSEECENTGEERGGGIDADPLLIESA